MYQFNARALQHLGCGRRHVNMRFKALATLLVVSLAAIAQATMTVDQVVAFIRSAISRKNDDRQVAAYLQKVHLSNRLEDRVVEELQGAGAGPKTVEALRALRDASASLAAAPAPAATPVYVPPPPPSAADQKKALADATDYVLNYEKNLPNFICTQVTRRYGDPGTGSFRAFDTINERLTYFDHHEDYKVITRNNEPVEVSHDKLQGAKSSGEFGSIMREIFAPQTETKYAWERWGRLRDTRMMVFSYRVPLSTSHYHIEVQEKGLNIVVGYSGLIFIDNDHHFVHQITLHAEDIPSDFPVQDLSIKLDYDYKKIGDAEYLLPLQFRLMSREGRMTVKNDVDFHLYRKFGTETTITFDTPPPISEEKTKETPIKK